MEAAGQLAMGKNWQVVKEPRGFIRFLQFILAIFAFATTCSVSTSIKFHINCNKTAAVNDVQTVSFGYAFNLKGIGFQVPVCSNGTQRGTTMQSFVDSQSAPAQFYVFIGVMAFLYSLAAIVFYIFCDDMYRKNTKITIGDFVITAVFAVFWLISSAAWAQGVSDVKYYSNPQTGIFNQLSYSCNDPGVLCSTDKTGDFASLNVSIIFGFLNMVVWGGNLWFLYKETPWFKGESSSSYTDKSSMPEGPVGGSPNSPTTS